MKELKTVTKDTFLELANEITKIENLDHLYKVGKVLTQFSRNGYKKALLLAYKKRKKELIREKIKEDEIFSNLYFLIKTTSGIPLKQVGKLIYNLQQINAISKAEADVLFGIYEKQKENEEKTTK